MFRRHSAALAALLVMAVPSLAAAQQATGDTSHRAPDRARARDERAITADTIKLHRELAVRDSARALLARDHAQTQADEARIDSEQAALARDRKATPRDTAAVTRDLAALTSSRKQLDRDLDRDKHEKARLATIEKKVRSESSAAIEAHHDLRQDRPTPAVRPDTGRRR